MKRPELVTPNYRIPADKGFTSNVVIQEREGFALNNAIMHRIAGHL
jgi:hypothetical protein